MSILGVIPARGGKQSVPGKNTRFVHGKPLIGYTIEAAKQSKQIDRLVVSTEDPIIAQVASSFGVEIIDRPTEIARDDSPIEASLRHAIKHLAEADRFVTDIVVLMQANVPVRKPGMVDRVIQTLIDTKGADSAVSVFEVDQWPQWMKLKNDKGFLRPFMKGSTSFRRQDLEKPYLLDGAVMAVRRSVLDATSDISSIHQYLGENVVAVVQEKEYSIEIDEEKDFLFTESILQYIASKG